jgi:hypothetical protein
VADALAGKRFSPARKVEGTHDTDRPERDEMPAGAPFARELSTGTSTERGNSLRDVVIEDGDVVIVRESAAVSPHGDAHSASSSPSQFRVSVRGHHQSVRLFTEYDQALAHAEPLAAERRVSLFYVDSAILILLKNHRPLRMS